MIVLMHEQYNFIYRVGHKKPTRRIYTVSVSVYLYKQYSILIVVSFYTR